MLCSRSAFLRENEKAGFHRNPVMVPIETQGGDAAAAAEEVESTPFEQR